MEPITRSNQSGAGLRVRIASWQFANCLLKLGHALFEGGFGHRSFLYKSES
jgi:hypothetical protein